MACYICSNLFIYLYLLIVSVLVLFVNGANVGVDISDDLLSELYKSYKEAQHIDIGSIASRRVLSDNKKYQIHIMKLNEVNGNKRHNLLVKEDNSTNPLIYIDNPVETKVPNAYLTFEEFKKELTERVLRLRKGFTTKAHFGTKPTAAKAKKEKEILKSFLTDIIKERKKTGPEIYHVLTKDKDKTNTNLSHVVNTKVNPKNDVTIKLTTTSATNQTIKDTKLRNKITEKASSQVAATASTSPITIANETSATNKFTVETSLESPNLTITKNPVIADAEKESLNVYTTINETSFETKITEQETLEVTIITENPIEPEVTEQLEMNDRDEHNSQLEVESTTASPVTTALTKKTTLSRPLVWMQPTENPEPNIENQES